MLWGVGSGGWSGGGRESALPFSVEAMPTGPSVGWTLGSRQEESYTLREQTTADGLLGTSSMRSFLPHRKRSRSWAASGLLCGGMWVSENEMWLLFESQHGA